ncbi:hypothetical protein JQ614_32225 [Bradyrhizobium diazoefficiens]|uniref:hypothetical protein n=1 Tax=Bradyrhizobium diazoefficiens TaxID=1355477 RepID=UPI001B8D8576|nr:hypothetical protein [Bradyrhizobium diazoefficiens]MBR0866296.1 hypothetical protein [Bradyrhizobium diazoefficiens]MBR0890757.1 hypothetical protein [Bradyrhizobium diazoefficiens]MBR0922590.1 hypothetical protein [Bradyrhizobium diazoefficiens]
MDDEVRKAAAGAIVEKHRDLMQQRADALRRRADIDREIRGYDRALFDCRAAGRLFGVDIELPEDVRPAVIVRPPNVGKQTLGHVAARQFRPAADETLGLFSPVTGLLGSATVPTPAPPLPPIPTVASTTLTPGAEPSIRDLILLYLKQAGAKGEKAALLRRKVETFLNRQIHYKTIGMSLYRLSKETPPAVRREGQIWFLAFPWVETKDPGAATPGSVEGR